MRNFGFQTLDDVVGLGTNAKMNEISAAMGLTGLESLTSFVAVNRSHYLQYQRELSDLPGIKLLPYNRGEERNWQYVVLEVDAAQAGLTRDDLVRVLHAEKVRARRYFFPGCHRIPPYRDLYPDAWADLPETERLTKSVICLPTGSALQSPDITAICAVLRLALDHSAELRPILSGEPQWLLMKDEEKR
jgi:dTDP-4-amino-4,6-dideoxygalactose transaminase